MSESVIKVSGLGKSYRMFNRPIDRIKQIFRKKPYYENFWALKDINFEVKRGETVGIVGMNGSGKSTLLQIVTGVLMPTEGQVEVLGRVAALLELGAGFNPEFTGKENVYLSGLLLGLSREEIDQKLDSIVDFSNIGDYINQPVKTYSSGMYVRLAFAVAINVDPDVLIVDEALAVGDMLFQAKCMHKMREMIRKGVTILFVSHDISTVKSLCSRCLYLKKGKQVTYGDAGRVAEKYVADIHTSINDHAEKHIAIDSLELSPQEDITGAESVLRSGVSNTFTRDHFAPGFTEYGNGQVEILDIGLFNLNYQKISALDIGQEFIVQASVRFKENLPSFAFGYSFRDLKGQMIVGKMTTNVSKSMPSVRKDEVYTVEITGKNFLKDGVYTVSLGFELPIQENINHIFLAVAENVVVFKSTIPADTSKIIAALVDVPVSFNYKKNN